MNEIKFRSAHYNYDGEFIGFSYWGFLNHKGEYDINCFCTPSSITGTERKQEEQYIGVKDSKGNELYKGDILAFMDKIEWYRGEYTFKLLNRLITKEAAINEINSLPYETRVIESIQDYDWLLRSEIQVYWERIGNIHQNADLLTK